MGDSCRILYIPEILRMILDGLTGDKRSIVSLAYSSKAVSGTALDYLWADMDSFAPFVPLLPDAVQNIWKRWFDTVSLLPSAESLRPEEWKHFDMYAYRVRHIRPREDARDRGLYQKLTSIRTGIDLFPRLLSLQCHIFDPLISGMRLFPSSLRSLSLYTEYGFVLDGRAELALCQAAHDAPYLEELRMIGTYRLYGESGPHPLDFKRLHTVHLNASTLHSADLQSFSHLLSAAPIQNLTISTPSRSGPHRSGYTGIPFGAFPHVETISIFDNPERAADIISRIRSPYLKSVTIDQGDRFTSILGYGRFFDLLAQRHPPICSLEIRICCVYFETPNEYIRGFLVALEPLVCAGLAKLRVEMTVFGSWEIEEDVEERLQLQAWPSLTDFEFVIREE